MTTTSTSNKLNGNAALRKMVPYMMLAPALIIIFVFKLFPMISVVIESFIRDGEFTFRT